MKEEPHSIRLRGPWQAEWMPQDHGSTLATYSRSFHLPTGLESDQAILLAVMPTIQSDDWGTLHFLVGHLNDSRLEFPLAVIGNILLAPIGDKLQSFNRLKLSMPCDELFALLRQSSRSLNDPPPPLSDFFDVQLAISNT